MPHRNATQRTSARLLRALLIGALICCALGTALQAGAWPRGDKKSFLASSVALSWPGGRRLDQPPDAYGTIYFERGFGARLTTGLDLGSADLRNPKRGKAIAFLRASLSSPSARHQIALDLGGGLDQGRSVLRLGASYGRGFTLGLGRSNGWVSLDWDSHLSTERGHTHKLDATLGLLRPRSKMILLLSSYRAPSGKLSHSVTPSFVRQLQPGLFIEIGVTVPLKAKPDPALKLGIWKEF